MNVNREELKLTKRGSVWKIEVGVYSQVPENSKKELAETKLWKFKIILN